jgi:hypothetical protein
MSGLSLKTALIFTCIFCLGLTVVNTAVQAKCEPTVHKSPKNRKVEGVGCTEKEAKEDARSKLPGICTGDFDPKCVPNSCTDKTKTCNAIAVNTNGEKFACAPQADNKCEGGSGFKCTLTVKSFECGCGCP